MFTGCPTERLDPLHGSVEHLGGPGAKVAVVAFGGLAPGTPRGVGLVADPGLLAQQRLAFAVQ